jgi:hypothetical protein
VNVLGPASAPDTSTDDDEYGVPLNISGIERVLLSMPREEVEAHESGRSVAFASDCWFKTFLNGMKSCTLIRERRFAFGA